MNAAALCLAMAIYHDDLGAIKKHNKYKVLIVNYHDTGAGQLRYGLYGLTWR